MSAHVHVLSLVNIKPAIQYIGIHCMSVHVHVLLINLLVNIKPVIQYIGIHCMSAHVHVFLLVNIKPCYTVYWDSLYVRTCTCTFN